MGAMDLVAQFELLSEAAKFAVLGGVFCLVAGFAALMERRRVRGRNLARLEQVGWMPWTSLFVLAAMLGGGLLAASLPVVLSGR